MNTFLSITDLQTLKEEGNDRNNFVSLVVNNLGTYTAAITRKVNRHSQTKETLTYGFFSDEEKHDIEEHTQDKIEIEWFYLKIEKESEKYSFPDIDARIKEIRKNKEKEVKTPSLMQIGNNIVDPQAIKIGQIPTQRTLFDNDKESMLPLDRVDNTIPYNQVSVNPRIIESIVRQLITCSIIISNENNIDIDRWVGNMTVLYEKRFGEGYTGIERFREWADTYIEFLTWNIEDKKLASIGFDQTDIQSIYIHGLIKALSKLPKNNYIKVYIDELKKYLTQ